MLEMTCRQHVAIARAAVLALLQHNARWLTGFEFACTHGFHLHSATFIPTDARVDDGRTSASRVAMHALAGRLTKNLG